MSLEEFAADKKLFLNVQGSVIEKICINERGDTMRVNLADGRAIEIRSRGDYGYESEMTAKVIK